MTKERIHSTGEVNESIHELENAAEKTRESLAKNLEAQAEKAEKASHSAEKEARHDINRALNKSPEKDQPQHEVKHRAKSAEKERKLTKKEQKDSFNKTMTSVQGHLSKPSRTFSKIIHNPVFEKVSDVTSRTIARPNAILAGSITSFALTLAIYTVAKIYGYPLSGAETIAAFAVGWAIGMIIDYARVAYSGRRG